MKFNVTFKENNEKIDLHFKEANVISDGGFERGYAQGKAQGELDGYIKGNSDGHQLGLLQGFENAKTKLEEIEITENGEYSPNSDIIGFNSVKVNVVPKSNFALFAQDTEPYTITENDLAGVTKIRTYLFQNIKNAVRIELPSTVTTIANQAFYYCAGVKEFYYNAKNVADFTTTSNVFHTAFRSSGGCTFIFGDEVESIPSYLFYVSNSNYYANVTKVVIGENVKTIGTYSIPSYLTNLKEVYYNASNATYKSTQHYNTYGASGVKFVVGNKVKTVPKNFLDHYTYDSDGNKSITELEFEEGCQIEALPSGSFYCENVTSVVVPPSIKTIEGQALFFGTSSVKATMKFLSTEPPKINRYSFRDGSIEKIIIPKGTLEDYKNKTNWSYYADYLEEATE